MKLPGIQRQEVQTLGRRDINIEYDAQARIRNEKEKGDAEKLKGLEFTRQARKEDLRGAGADFDTMRQEIGSARSYYQAGLEKARATGSMLDSIGGMLQTGAQLSQDNQIRKAKRHGQETDLDFQERVASFAKRFEGRDFIEPDELTGAADTASNRARKQIPTAEVLPIMLKEYLDEAMGESSQIIENEYFRNEWMKDAQMKSNELVSKADVLANAHLENQIIKASLQEVKDFREEHKFAQAIAVVDGMPGTEDEKKNLYDEINNEREYTGYEDDLSELSKVALKTDIKFLSLPYDEYRAKGGALDSGEKLTWRNLVQGGLNRLEGMEDGKRKNDVSMIKYTVKAMKDQMMNYSRLPPTEELDKIILDMQDSNAMSTSPTPPFSHADFADIAITKQATEAANHMSGMPHDKRVRDINAAYVESASSGTQILNNKVVDIVRNHNEKRGKLEQTDFAQSLIENHYELIDIKYPRPGPDGKISPEDLQGFAQSISKRNEQINIIGEGLEVVPQGPVSIQEAQSLSEAFSKIPNSQENELFGAIAVGMSAEDARRMYDQLAVEGTPSSSLVKGELYLDGKAGVSAVIAKGEDHVKLNDMSKINSSLNPLLKREFGALFIQNSTRHAMYKEAVYNHYIGLAISGEDVFEDLVAVNDDMLEQSIQAIVGNTMKHGGRRMQTLDPSLNERESRDYLLRLSDGFFTREEFGGGVNDGNGGVYSESEMRQQIYKQNLRLEQRGPGEFFVLRGNVALERKDNGEAYWFKYDPQAEMTTYKLYEEYKGPQGTSRWTPDE